MAEHDETGHENTSFLFLLKERKHKTDKQANRNGVTSCGTYRSIPAERITR